MNGSLETGQKNISEGVKSNASPTFIPEDYDSKSRPDELSETEKNLVSPLRKAFALVAIVLWIILVPIVFFVCQLFRYSKIDKVPRFFHRGCCKIFGLKATTKGEITTHSPTLFVANHVSYLDVFVLGGIVPGCFIAKSEVANWPVLGKLARFQNTLFFKRDGKHAQGQVTTMRKHLLDGGNLILFPEGTSTEGEHVEPFKSSLFSAAELESDEQCLIQPVTVSYVHCKGKPMTRFVRDHFAWYATMPFLSHFINVAGIGSAEVELIYHPPVRLNDFESRKVCAQYCQEQVASGLQVSQQHDGSLVQVVETAGVETIDVKTTIEASDEVL